MMIPLYDKKGKDGKGQPAAEESVKHEVVLHLHIVSWYDITITMLNQDT